MKLSSHKSVLKTDFSEWPEFIKASAVHPVFERKIEAEELEAYLQKRRGVSYDWLCPENFGFVFPKIGVCSWKEWPWLIPYDSQSAINLFLYCSERMRSVLAAWRDANAPAYLRFFPFIDYSDANEFRFQTYNGALTRSILRSPEAFENSARELFQKCAPHLEDCILDIAVRRKDGGAKAWVVEINPRAS